MIKKFTLDNGIRVVYERMDSIRSAAFGVWVGAGSRHESDGRYGISHFIEHMLFKGTGRRTAKQIAEEIDYVGGYIDAFTAKDCTCFHTKTLDSHMNIGIDILSDMIWNSKLAEADVNLERNVILEEINMYEDSPDELAHDLLAEAVWNGCPLGIPTIGRPETIAKIDSGAMREYLASMYTPENIVISAAGSFDEGELLARAGEAFGGQRDGGGVGTGRGSAAVGRGGVGTGRGNAAAGRGGAGQNSSAGGADLDEVRYNAGGSVRQKDTEQINLCVGFDGVELGDDDVYALHLANSLFGGGMSSVLFQKIREELGLVYSIYSYVSAYRRAGLYVIYAAMQTEQAERVYNMVLDEVAAFRKSGVTGDLLAKSKERFKGSFYMGLESPNARMSSIGKSELLLGYINTPEEIVKKIEDVTLDGVYAVMDRVFNPEKLAFSAVGRIDGALEKSLRRAR
jgi:predicted Zn-dependent peptidase